MHFYYSKLSTFLFLSLMCLYSIAYSNNDDGASDLGVDYAFLTLMTLSPDFAAANYTVKNDNGSEVDITITRFPYHFSLMKNEVSNLQFELSLAYQRTREIIQTFPTPNENIDAEWDTYGAGIGLLYEYYLTEHLFFTPSLRLGVARMKNHASYNGVLTDIIKNQFEGTLFNWKTNSSIQNLGLGLDYKWKLLGRSSSITTNVYHIMVDSFSESNEAVKFSENANLLSMNADMVFPSKITLLQDHVDFILLLGVNNFFGENRETLGYTTSYKVGLGAEHPIKLGQNKSRYLRVSGQLFFADNMNGWHLTIGYKTE